MAHMKDQRRWLDDLGRFGRSPYGGIQYRAAEVFMNKAEIQILDHDKTVAEACDIALPDMLAQVKDELDPQAIHAGVQIVEDEVFKIVSMHWKYEEGFDAWLSLR